MSVSIDVWRARIGCHAIRSGSGGQQPLILCNANINSQFGIWGELRSTKISVVLCIRPTLFLDEAHVDKHFEVFIINISEQNTATDPQGTGSKLSKHLNECEHNVSIAVLEVTDIQLIIGGIETNPGPGQTNGIRENPRTNTNADHVTNDDHTVSIHCTLTAFLAIPLENRSVLQNHAFYGIRLASFVDWPHSKPSGREVAKAGFIYTKEGDFVVCHFCEIKIGNWKSRSQPLLEHETLSPNCRFITKVPGTNIELCITNNTNEAGQNLIRNALEGNWQQTPDESSNTHASLFDTTQAHESQGTEISSRIPNSMGNMVPPSYDVGQSYQETITSEVGLEQPGRPRSEQEVLMRRSNEESFMHRNNVAGITPTVENSFSFCNNSSRQASSAIPSNNEVFLPPAQEVRHSFQEHNEHVVLRSANPVVGRPAASMFNDEDVGIVRPYCEEYSSFQSRLDSFLDWPANKEQRPSQMADAGFYFLHVGDQVKCYHCNGALNNWVPGDVAWIEHTKWFPTCAFVARVQGQRFVQEVCNGGQPTPVVNIVAEIATSQRNSPPTGPQMRPNGGDPIMNTPIMARAKDMGFSEAELKKALQKRRGRMFESIDELVEVLINIDSTMSGSYPPGSGDIQMSNPSVTPAMVEPTSESMTLGAVGNTAQKTQTGRPKHGKVALKKKKVPTATLR